MELCLRNSSPVFAKSCYRVKVLIATTTKLYLSKTIVRIANVGTGILEVRPGDEVPEVGLDKPRIPDPANLLNLGFGVNLAKEFCSVISLNSDWIFWSDCHSRII